MYAYIMSNNCIVSKDVKRNNLVFQQHNITISLQLYIKTYKKTKEIWCVYKPFKSIDVIDPASDQKKNHTPLFI